MNYRDISFRITFRVLLASVLIIPGCTWNNFEDQVPPSVVTDYVSDVTNTTAVCAGILVSNGGSWWVDRGICWSNIVDEPTLNDAYTWISGGSGTGSFSATLGYLTPGTTYYVRAFAASTSGTNYGEILQFTTTGDVTGEIVFQTASIYGTVTDVEGNSYKTIQIGTQTWMAENLKSAKYNDGTDIPLVESLTGWLGMTTPGFSWYLNDRDKYKNIYGALYNWHSVKTGKLCPAGWHVPGDSEWTTLTNYLGGEADAGEMLKENSPAHWIEEEITVTNSSGFTALPGGVRWGIQSEPAVYFTDLGYFGHYWSATEYNDPSGSTDKSLVRNISWATNECKRLAYPKSHGISVRCVKD